MVRRRSGGGGQHVCEWRVRRGQPVSFKSEEAAGVDGLADEVHAEGT